MSSLERPEDDGETEDAPTDEAETEDSPTAGTGAASATVPLPDAAGDAVLSVPPTATAEEAAAVAAAVGAHLTDRQRAVARAAVARDDGADRVDAWKLADRMHAVGRRRYPGDVERGNVWAAASRGFDR